MGIFVAQARQKKKILPWLTLFEKLGSSFIFFGVIQPRRPINKSTYKKKKKKKKRKVMEIIWGAWTRSWVQYVQFVFVAPFLCHLWGYELASPTWNDMVYLETSLCWESCRLQPPWAKDYLGAFGPIKTSSKAKLLGSRGKIIYESRAALKQHSFW